MKKISSQELERRLALDFNKSLSQILAVLHEYYTQVTPLQIEQWEKQKVLEYCYIKGEKRYFKNAARNVLRLDPEGHYLRLQKEGEERGARSLMLADYIPKIISGHTDLHRRYTMRFTITVHPDVVPQGELLRCWLPYPRMDQSRQKEVRLVSCNPFKHQLAPIQNAHSSIYLEAKTLKGEPTIFEVIYQFTSVAEFHNDYPSLAHSFVQEGFDNYLCECKPHIVFSDKLKQLAETITGDLNSACEKAQAIFLWINAHYPWGSAREYSTIPSIPEYVVENRHGDCGQVSLLFITLCRICGIPARWQSGFMLHPGFENLHDWAEIYLQGMGWVPVDQSFGPQHRLSKATEKLFYFGGIDAFRMIVNNDFSQPLYPEKKFERSETVDFQRGEVEWKHGNLYFDCWDYDFQVKPLF